MTDRLYYTDPYSLEFDAKVLGVAAEGGRTLVHLDRTCFYPTTGGQPFDTGALNSHRVVDVLEDDGGDIIHVVDANGPGLSPGVAVHGAVDRERRFDHMQQHTGQHVLSAAFDRLSGVRTVSFHLGAAVSTIDLAREVRPDELAKAEEQANRVVWENRPVTVRFVSADEAARLPLRKEPVREGTLRLIDVRDFDLSACGGTHVSHTGEIGIIAVTAWERFKGGQRLEFVCGRRALDRIRMLRDSTARSASLLSVQAAELPGAIERLQSEARDQRRAQTALQTELARYRAGELASNAQPTPRGRLAAHAVDGDAGALKNLAAAIVSHPGYVAVLVSNARPALVVVARSSDVNVAANDVLARLTSRFGGKGGGKPDLAQGGGLDADAGQILAEASAILSA
jgi:alanyl-tRNA synthetase